MIGFHSQLLSLRSLIASITVIVLSGALWIVGTHHHAPSGAHGCHVCTIAHAPLVIDDTAASVSAPRPIRTRVLERITSAPAPVAFGSASSRAPPQS